MIAGVWGKKVGMTQVFTKKTFGSAQQSGKKSASTGDVIFKDIVVPVTAIALQGWFVIGYKMKTRDGYDAVKIGCARDRYADKPFAEEWIKKPATYFLYVREVKVVVPEGLSQEQFSVHMKEQGMSLGAPFNILKDLREGSMVDAFGVTKGAGFAGVVRRHGFTGARASHGAAMGNRPGSMGGSRMQGKIMKGKRLPGHMGVNNRSARNLEIVKIIDGNHPLVLVKGSVPGKAGSLVFLRKVSSSGY